MQEPILKVFRIASDVEEIKEMLKGNIIRQRLIKPCRVELFTLHDSNLGM